MKLKDPAKLHSVYNLCAFSFSTLTLALLQYAPVSFHACRQRFMDLMLGEKLKLFEHNFMIVIHKTTSVNKCLTHNCS